MIYHTIVLLSIFSLCVAFPTSWQQINPAVTPKDIDYASYGDGSWGFLAGSAQNRGIVPELILTSDFVNFQKTELSVDALLDLGDLVWGNAGWLVVINDTAVLSADGISWQQYNLPYECAMDQVVYGNGYYVGSMTPSPTGTIAYCYSTDGLTWTFVNVPTENSIYYFTLGFAGNTLWAYGFGSQVAYATDLTTKNWVFQNAPGFNGTSMYVFETNNNALMMVGADQYNMHLTFFTWEASSSKWVQGNSVTCYNSAETDSFTYGNNLFVYFTGVWSATADFKTFYNISSPWSEYEIYDPEIQYLGNQFVAFGVVGEIATSQDGQTWTLVGEGLHWPVYTTFFYDNQFVITTTFNGYFPGIYTSNDALTWTQVSTAFAPDLQWVPAMKQFVGTANSYEMMMSPSLSGPWTSISTPTGVNSWAYGNGILMIQNDDPEWAGSSGSIYALADGSSTWDLVWTAVGPGCPPCRLETMLSTIVFNSIDNKFYVLNYINGTIMTSSDGKEWELNAPPSQCEYIGSLIDSGNNIYMGCYNNFFVSTGNNNWQPTNGLGSAYIGDLQYLEEAQYYIGSGVNGTTFYSKDGLNWSAGEEIYDTLDQIDFIRFAAGNGKIIGVGGFLYQGTGNIIYEASL